jgi:hypothetical protein
MNNFTALMHNSYPHGDTVQPITDEEKDCLIEIRDILKKHDKLERFGVTLLHKHFEIAEDEILLEDTDEKTRTQTIRPVKRQDVLDKGDQVLETCWSLSDGAVFMACRRGCAKQDGGHYNVHVHSF